MTFFSSRVIGRVAAAECGVVAAVAIGFPSIDVPGDPGSGPQASMAGFEPRHRDCMGSHESIEREANSGLCFHNSQLVFATSV
jgi:hypothetical protein